VVEAPLSRIGFARAADLSFSRESGDALQLISFSVRQDAHRGFCFSFGAGVRFPAVEALLGSGPEQQLFPTIGKPLSVLKSDTDDYFEWCVTKGTDMSTIRREVMLNIKQHALPFLERYSTLTSVESSLAQDDPAHWFVLNPEQRVTILAAIVHVRGDKRRSLELLDEALQHLSDAPPKKRRRLEQLRQRISA
jgi:hypothetical protein